MKYKVGDRVRVRGWAPMAEEFDLDSMGYINIDDNCFSPSMKHLCGQAYTIEKLGDIAYYVNGYWLDSKMIEGYAFEWGELIEASDNGETWYLAKYLSYTDGGSLKVRYPYTIIKLNQTIRYTLARPIDIGTMKVEDVSKERLMKYLQST